MYQAHEHFIKASRPLSAEQDAPVFGPELQIGSIVYFRGELTREGYNKVGGTGFRPGLVYSLWRQPNGHIGQIEVFNFTSNLSRTYPSDMVIDSAELQKDFGRNRPVRLKTDNIYMIENRQSHVQPSISFVIEDSYWPAILARRVQALIYDRSRDPIDLRNYQNLVREGFTFENLDAKNIRKTEIEPDVFNCDVARIPSPILSQALIDDITEFANSYHLHKAGLGERTVYPPFEKWRASIEETPVIPFPVWRPTGP